MALVGYNIITYIGHLQEKTNNFVFHGTRSTSRQHLVTKKLNTVPAGYNQPTAKQSWTDKNNLVKLHKRLIQAQTNAVSASLRWRSVIDNIVLLEVRGTGINNITQFMSNIINKLYIVTLFISYIDIFGYIA